MSNIILIGMPACGKSTVGVILAKTLGIGFVDTDLIIQQREKRLLQDIINSNGIEYFLDCECDAIMSLDYDNCVISTGGSAVFRERAMARLKEKGRVIYLDVPLAQIKERLNNISTRGIAAAADESIDDIFAQRLPLYKKYADITVSLPNSLPEQTVEKICEILK